MNYGPLVSIAQRLPPRSAIVQKGSQSEGSARYHRRSLLIFTIEQSVVSP